jgi:hypothetical protein
MIFIVGPKFEKISSKNIGSIVEAISYSKKSAKTKLEKNERNKTLKIWSFIKTHTLLLKCDTNVSQQRMNKDEQQRVTEETSCTLLGVPTTTAYKTTTECRKYRGRLMTEEQMLLIIRYKHANI